MAKTLDEAGVKRLIQEIKGANKDLNTPIPISTENTPESMAQNVKNIADYVEKAKAAGVDTTKSFRLTLEINGYPVEGSYDTSYGCIYGLELTDDGFAYLDVVNTTVGNVYFHIEFITPNSEQKVTSSMLAQGARKPIILTPSTTEVDEETYQKLLSDDVDVVFEVGEVDSGADFCTLVFKEYWEDGSRLQLYFTNLSLISSDAKKVYFDSYFVDILDFAPHKITVTTLCEDRLDSLLENSLGFLPKNKLSPVLQEIDLTGTDAERKAKLDKFERDWKALTGVSNLSGARFVGKALVDSNEINGVLTYNIPNGVYSGICRSEIGENFIIEVSLDALTITRLFSHLEAITIKTNNSTLNKVANVAAIKAYVDNLIALGVDVTKGYMIPVKIDNGYHGFIMGTGADREHTGIIKMNKYNYGGGWIFIDKIGTYMYLECLTLGIYDDLTTTAKTIVPAINEINALAKGYSTIFTPIELTTETAQNKTAIDARVAAFTAQGISLTNGCCIPVTYKGVYAGNISLINGDWYGLLVKNTNSPADNINVKLSADGTIVTSNSAQ